MSQPDPDTAKLVTLARAAKARLGAAEGAAVSDETGRSYVACTVSLPSLSLSALQAAVAAAVSSGVTALRAGCVVSAADSVDVAAFRDLGPAAPVYLADPSGTVTLL